VQMTADSKPAVRQIELDPASQRRIGMFGRSLTSLAYSLDGRDRRVPDNTTCRRSSDAEHAVRHREHQGTLREQAPSRRADGWCLHLYGPLHGDTWRATSVSRRWAPDLMDRAVQVPWAERSSRVQPEKNAACDASRIARAADAGRPFERTMIVKRRNETNRIMIKSTAGWYVALGLLGAVTMACGATGDIGDDLASVDVNPDALEDEHELGSLESSITTTQITYQNCSTVVPPGGGDSNRTKVQKAVNIVLDLLYDPVESSRFLACMKNGTMSATGTYPEQQFHLLREPIPTTIVCDDPLDRGYVGHVPAPSDGSPNSREVVHFGFFDVQVAPPPAPPVRTSVVATQTVDGLAELILHELVHTKGYYLLPRGNGHPGPEVVDQGIAPCEDGCIERQMAVPIVATSCMFDNRTNDWNGLPSFPDQIIPLRSEMATSTGEVTLAPVGNIRNTEAGYENHCLTNQIGVGLRGRYDSNFVTALGMVCREGDGPVHYVGKTGATSGGSYTFACPVNEALIGVSGRSGWWLDAIKPICANIAAWQPPFRIEYSTVTPPSFGGSGGEAFSRICSPGHAVKGLRLRWDGVFRRMDVVCQKIGQPGNIQTVSLPTIGAPGTGSLIADEHCPSKSVMTKLWGVADTDTNKLRRLGAGCSKVSNEVPGGALTLDDNNANHMLPFGGAWFVPESGPDQVGIPGTGVGRTATCQGQGLALVGMKTYTLPGASSVSAVRALCANVAAWSNGSTSWAMGGRVGNDVGTSIKMQICPPKHFLTGWRMAEEPDVTNIALRCRQF
jgi:hypothetical protein